MSMATVITASCCSLTFSDRIRDQETEKWMTLLKFRDERMRHGLTEEELRDIHADIVGKVKQTMDEVKQNVTVEQQQQQTQQQNMQATSMYVTIICCCELFNGMKLRCRCLSNACIMSAWSV